MTGLRASWARTRTHLAAARQLLPVDPRTNPEGGSLQTAKEYLDANELGLALEEFEGLGEVNEVVPAYWRTLADAATEMGLHEAAARLRSLAGG